jgi:phenol/toluene 2-monooxygenase (NADH) P4/A4
MTVKALYEYDYPSRDRQENFGDDLLVNVQWVNNPMFPAPACFRAPKAMPWADFKAHLIDPWAASDPDYDPAAPKDWQVVGGQAIDTGANPLLADTGVVHKGIVTFRT